jgi:hypothetical protein
VNADDAGSNRSIDPLPRNGAAAASVDDDSIPIALLRRAWRRSRFSLLALPGAIAFWLAILTVFEASTNPLGNAELEL